MFRRLSRYFSAQLARICPRSLFVHIILIARFTSVQCCLTKYQTMNSCKHALSIQPVFAICLPMFVDFIKLAYV